MATVLSMTAAENEEQINEKSYYQTKQERTAKEKKFRTPVPDTNPNNSNQAQGNNMATNPLPAHPVVGKSQRSDGMPPKDTNNAQLSTNEKTQQTIKNELALRNQKRLTNGARNTYSSAPTLKRQ